MPKFSVRKPFTVLVGVIIIIILGVISFSKMTADLLPSMNFPYLIVTTTYVGASPEKVESTISAPLEQALATTSNVKTITSTSSENYSMVMLEFESNTNIDSAIIELNSKLDLVKASWTDDKISSPIITKINPDMLPIMVTGVEYNGLQGADLTNFLNNEIIPKLERIDGVASVTATGLVEEKVQVKLNQEKIDEINDKILASIDSELLKTEKELKSAKYQLNNGKAELERQSVEQNAKIDEGLVQINAGIEEINKANAEILEQEQQLKTLKTILEGALELLNNGKIDEAIEAIKKEIPDFPTDKITLKDELNNKLKEVTEGLSQIANGKTEINNQLTELNNKKVELENGKKTLNTELEKAKSQLSSQEYKLNQGMKDFESAREEAYKNASLSGVLTSEMISNILMADNFAMPAGYIDQTEDNKIIVKVGNEFSNLDEIKNLTMFSFEIEGLENVTLEQLADIEMTNNQNNIYAKINGNDAVMFSFQKQSSASTGNVSDNIKNEIEKLQEQYDGLSFMVLMDQGIYIDMVIGSVLENLLYGAILAVLVLFIFLRDIKPTIAVALSIPVSLTFAIALMYFSGVSINIISLSGLALSVGMLVDNAIVVIENIYRLRNKGVPLKEAAVEGTKSVTGAIFASTLTTICVFLPIVFVEGITRQLFQDMALTIAYSLLASLIVALTVIPAMTSKLFTKEKNVEHKFFDKIVNLYEKILNKALEHKKTVLFGSVILLGISIALVFKMGLAFIPEMEGTQASVSIEFNKEVTQSEQRTISDEILTKLAEIEDVESVGALKSTNSSGMMSGSSNIVSIYMILNENRKLSNADLENQVLEKASGYENLEISVSTSNMDMSSLGGSGIQVKVKGDNLDEMQNTIKELEELFKDNEGVLKIENGIDDASVETRIVVDKNKAMEYGLTVAQIYSLVSEKLSKEIDSTTLSIDNKDYPVIVTKTDEEILTKDTLENFEIEGTKNNEKITLKISELVQIEEANALNSINRENSTRYITMTILIDANHNVSLVSRDIEKELNEYINNELEDGIDIELAGENESIISALKDLLLMIGLAVILIYLIMVAQFQSLKAPFLIMFTIPLAFTGGLLALFITGKELSVISMVGFLVLAGIVVNNGIVLVDYINQLINSGKSKKEALIEAGRTRLRPILMTALTTILGMLTMALGLGMGADMIQPLGIVTIGGLLYSTILTLVVVPCMYDVMFRKVK